MGDAAEIDFCGEIHTVSGPSVVSIGRDGDVAIDDNPYLHRRFLEVGCTDSIVWIANVGTQLSATLADSAGLMQAWLRPGARVPIVFPTTNVWFTAGPTTYDLSITLLRPQFEAVSAAAAQDGDTTLGRLPLTIDQRRLVLALAEPLLRRGNRGGGSIPTSADAARRLGWPLTKFNRKLDNVCEKLTKAGIPGMHGSSERLASNRRARLVEYAVAVRLVEPADLELLDG